MHPARLQRIADQVVRRTLEELPADIRSAAEDCPVELALMWQCRAEEPDLEDDLLGLFEGLSRDAPAPETPDQFPRIRLFVDNLWDAVGGNPRKFRHEVRVTYLHELGHYLGFDEAAVAELGLG